MRLYFFRQTDEISMDDIKATAKQTQDVLGIDVIVFERSVNEETGQTDISKLLRISDSYTERKEPVVAIVFTEEKPVDGTIPRDGSERSKGAWVNASGNAGKTFLSLLHQLGHIFEAEHCPRKDCLMYPYYTRNSFNEKSMEDLFCSSCLQKIKESWIYSRLISSAKARKEESKTIPSVISSLSNDTAISSHESKVNQEQELPQRGNERRRAFPDWSLPKEEFIGKVKEFFGYVD